MNLKQKLPFGISIGLVLSVFFAIPVVSYWLPIAWYHWEGVQTADGIDDAIQSLLPLLSLLAMIAGLITLGSMLFYLYRQVVLPIRRAVKYTEAMANGESADPLPYSFAPGREMGRLYSSLNILYDRQQNLMNRLKKCIDREAELREEMVHQENLQLQTLTYLLPQLRQPLNAARGYTELLTEYLKRQNPDEAALCAGKMRESILAQTILIERMIDISRLSHLQHRIVHFEGFDTAEFMHELVQYSSFSLQEHHLSLVNHFSVSAPARLILDRDQLLQILNIMLRTVARASSRNEHLVISCFRENGTVSFEVRDSKKCPAREMVELNCDENAEGNSRKSSLSTLGVGLLQNLCSRLGGKFTAGSSPEAHTVLRLDFKEADCMDARAQWSHSARHESAGQALSGETQEPWQMPAGLPVKRILMLDDFPADIWICEKLLAFRNLKIEGVASLREFYYLAERELFDGFIIADCCGREKLPGIVEHLRTLCGKRENPLVIISPLFPDEISRQLVKYKNLFYMTKPLNYPLLAGKLREEA